MTIKKLLLAGLITIAACAAVAWWTARPPAATRASAVSMAPAPVVPAPDIQRPLRVLHIMSYDSAWAAWTLAQFDAFKAVLSDLPVEYRVVEMDVRRNTSEASKHQAIERSCRAIDEWMPDLVYTTDDFVQSSVVRHYLNSSLPFVFSGVNAEPGDYGFDRASNVTGVLEREHIAQTGNLLRQLVPTARRLAIISDTGETWPKVIQRIRDCEREMGLIVVAADRVETYAEYQQKIRSYQGVADAICTLGIFTLKDDGGAHVLYQQVGRWTYENSSLPTISFWDSRPAVGALCAVSVSARAQGETAGQIARQILVEGKSPADFPIQPTLRGQPIINLAVARRLNIKPPSTTLLTAKVVSKCEWE